MNDCKITQGERFKDARVVHNRHGLQSTKVVSEQTGISTSIINALENETRSVGYEKVIILAKHYGVSIDWLSCLTDDPNPQPCAVDELGLSDKAVSAIQSISKRPEDMEILNKVVEHNIFPIMLANIIEYKEVLHAIPLSDKEMDLIEEHWQALFEKHPRLSDRVRYIYPGLSAKSCLFEARELFVSMVKDIADPTHLAEVRQALLSNMADHYSDEYFESVRNRKGK